MRLLPLGRQPEMARRNAIGVAITTGESPFEQPLIAWPHSLPHRIADATRNVHAR
jgi:hypothetical protein